MAFMFVADPRISAGTLPCPDAASIRCRRRRNSRFVEIHDTLRSELRSRWTAGTVNRLFDVALLRRRVILIDSPQTRNGGDYPASKQFEWKRFLTDLWPRRHRRAHRLPGFEFHWQPLTTSRRNTFTHPTAHHSSRTKHVRPYDVCLQTIALFLGIGGRFMSTWGCSWAKG